MVSSSATNVPPSGAIRRSEANKSTPRASDSGVQIPSSREELQRMSVRDLKALLMTATGRADPKYTEKREYVDALLRLSRTQ